MKYPRSYHFSFSPEIHKDDKIISKEQEHSFEEEEIVITEKIDGGNCCLFEGNVFARSHSTITFHPSFSKVKQLYSNIFYTKDFDFNRYRLFGENVQAIHSIEYTDLRTCFFLFGVYDTKNEEWLSWDEVVEISIQLDLNHVPLIFRGYKKDLKNFFKEELKNESFCGGEREGFYVRKPGRFNDLTLNVGKYVRKGHVQSEEYWSEDWKPQKIKEAL